MFYIKGAYIMNRKKYLLIYVVVSLIFLSGCTFSNKPVVEVEKGPVPVVTEIVEFKTISQGERFIGKIKPNKNVLVYPKTTAKIEKIYVEQGDIVAKQQILMKLDATYVNDSLLQAEAAYQSAISNLNQAKERQSSSIIQTEAQLAIAEDTFNQAQKNLDDMTEKHEDGWISDSQFDQAKSAFLQAENNLKIAKDSVVKAKSNSNIEAVKIAVDQAELGVKQAKRALVDTNVYASIAGQVASINVGVGDMASPQIPAIQIINQDIVYVSLNVTGNSLKNFKEGRVIDIYIPSLEQKVEGKVTFISPIANEQTLTFLVEVEINNQNNQLKSGMFVETILTLSNNEEYIVIPTRAVMGTGKETYVYIVDDGKAYKKDIEVMDMSTEETILISGLAVDDVIIVKGQYSVVDGSEVEIVK